MNKALSLLMLFILMCVPVSADTFEIEIWEDSGGIYYVTVDNGELQECNDTICMVEIENNTVTTLSLSDGDIRYIAEYTSKQLEIDGFKPEGADLEGGVNETITRAIMWDVVAEWGANERAYRDRTLMPEVEKFNNLTLKLAQAEGALETTNARFAGHDAVVEGYKVSIGILEREDELKNGFIIILACSIIVLLLDRSDTVRALRERREK